MKTRMELWKSYRDDIQRNNELQNAVRLSNAKFRTLFERLSKVDPSFDEKYFKQNYKNDFLLKDIGKHNELSHDKIYELLNLINKTEEKYSYSLNYIDKITFSSEELIDIFESMKDGISKKMEYIDDNTAVDISIETKVVNLGRLNMKLNIAIDGPSGTGKSSVAKLVAEKFKLKYINTGLVYRSIALNAIELKVDLDKPANIIEALKNLTIELLDNEEVKINDVKVTKKLRGDDVSQASSKVAAIPEVRMFALKIMKDAAKYGGIIMDGRDTTFRVLPNADLKFFITTDIITRTKRRVKQNKKLGLNVDYDKVFNEIQKRDNRDTTREFDPLHVVEDAVLVDSSNMTLNDVVDVISMNIENLLKRRKNG
ncbi:(d)CMP kinase [Candidatus Mycoplasma mahonii]|uniref:(d)CMP kinase n=1 Tax=Candidatus Mycoplasma mahonii TaxID=3004105 RepID=UPI0026F011F8|nr:(d)CMP kinase [Candidatus Mycoplasma mahonii]WKX02617.1 (d)CMP kinase [Candidatus Mycoplasma mahonii]